MNLLGYLSLFLAMTGSAVGPMPQRSAQDSSFGRFEAMKRADRDMCERWLPKVRQANRSSFGGDVSAYARLTKGLEPAWAPLDASRYREFLNEWMFANSRSPAPQRSMTRRETNDLVARHLRLGTIRIWRANAKFRALDGNFSLTRIGILPIDPAKPPKRVTAADFDRIGYRYVISKTGAPTAAQVDPMIDHDPQFAFMDKGFTYFINPDRASLGTGKDAILSLMPRSASPSLDRGSFALNRACN